MAGQYSVSQIALVARFLSVWKQSERDTVSVDRDMFVHLFNFIEPKHTVHDQSGNPVFLVLDKETAIEQATLKYGLHDGPPKHRSNL